METETDLRVEQPYRVEYAKSGRAGCKGCSKPIDKGDVRLAIMVQSRFGDFKQAMWHHFDCFFKKHKPPSTGDIAHFGDIKYEDQKRIEGMLKGGKGPVGDSDEFSVEYAKSNRSSCQLCENKIPKDEVRISKLDRHSENALMYGPQKKWFHVECFVNTRNEVGFVDSGTKIPGFSDLQEDDQKMLKKKLPAIAQKRKADEKTNREKKTKKDPLENKLKKQSDMLYGFISEAEKMKSKHVMELLQYNDQEVAKSTASRNELLADCMAFGALEKCPDCKNGQLRFRIAGYICCGNTEWGKCLYQTTTPERKPFVVPDHLKEEYEFLENYEYKKRSRLLPKAEEGKLAVNNVAEAMKPSTSAVAGDEANGEVKLPFHNQKVAAVGKLRLNKKQLKDKVQKLGGTLVNEVDRTVLFVVSSKKEVDRDNAKILDAKKIDVPVVSDEIFDALEDVKPSQDICPIIVSSLIVPCNSDIEKRYKSFSNREKVKNFKSGSGQSGSGKRSSGVQKLKVKGGLAVDPETNLEHIAHVLKEGKVAYTVVLNKVDIVLNKNSYYKIQLLEADKGSRYWVYRAWGRIGTAVGGTKLDDFMSKDKAIKQFEELYQEQTGNTFTGNKADFKKVPGKYYPVDIDYGIVEEVEKKPEIGQSKLPMPIQELLSMIFDIQKMKEQMVEYNLDLSKMPLGKISKDQVRSAYSVLSEISEMISKADKSLTKLLEASNRFYSLIPHDFGVKNVPVINTKEDVQSKMEMLDSLLEMEHAYDIVSDVKKESADDPLSVYYEKLNASIKVLDKKSDEYALIEKYTRNTHAATHSQYSLKIVDVFEVTRSEEPERFSKFKDLHNRMLLWHGSRTTNYAGILSQGLRIAPPEAPVTGYMFGKGVYFADMVSKSANYCYTNSSDNVGLLLLNEVALGNIWELYQAKDVKKPTNGKHSVKGVGRTHPKPEEHMTLSTGVVVPCGTPAQNHNAKNSVLMYNEYIVYDVAQVHIKYLVKVKFDYKY